MEIITAYGCSYCGMTSRHKYSVSRHESFTCKKNQYRSRCGNCEHLFEDSETHYNPNHNGNPGSTDHDYPVWYCLKLEVEIEQQELNINNSCPEWKIHTIEEGK